MMPVIHFRRQLFAPPDVVDVPGICVRAFDEAGDISAWLELRERAMADQTPRIRTWSLGDFRAEMLGKSWWRAERTWVAVADDLRVVGAVTLALREGATATIPVIHWLLVDPGYRRRGIGRVLISHLERSAWNSGWREIQLE